MHAHALKAPAQPPRATRQALPHCVRARLKLGGTRDEAEQQADRIAAQALGKVPPVGAETSGFGAAVNGRAALRRALAPVAEGARPQAPVEEDQALPETLEREVAALQSGGQPLPPPLRADMPFPTPSVQTALVPIRVD